MITATTSDPVLASLLIILSISFPAQKKLPKKSIRKFFDSWFPHIPTE